MLQRPRQNRRLYHTGYEPTISKYLDSKYQIFAMSGRHISSLPRKARYLTMIRRSRHRDANQGSFKHQVRCCISKPSQGVTVAILAWPPHEAVAAFGTRLGRAGTVPDRSEGLDGAPFRSRGRALSRIQDRNNKHARGARVRGPGPAAYSQLGLCSTVSADILLVVIKRHQRARVPIVV